MDNEAEKISLIENRGRLECFPDPFGPLGSVNDIFRTRPWFRKLVRGCVRCLAFRIILLENYRVYFCLKIDFVSEA